MPIPITIALIALGITVPTGLLIGAGLSLFKQRYPSYRSTLGDAFMLSPLAWLVLFLAL